MQVIKEDYMEICIEAWASLLPYKTYILTAVALFVLIGIAGGGKVVIKDLKVGELKLGARCTSMLTGLVLAVIFILIPEPPPEHPPETEHVSIRGGGAEGRKTRHGRWGR